MLFSGALLAKDDYQLSIFLFSGAFLVKDDFWLNISFFRLKVPTKLNILVPFSAVEVICNSRLQLKKTFCCVMSWIWWWIIIIKWKFSHDLPELLWCLRPCKMKMLCFAHFSHVRVSKNFKVQVSMIRVNYRIIFKFTVEICNTV